MLTFQGPQGIGKTSWVKALVSEPKLRDSVVKLDHHLDTSNRDSILGAIENRFVEIGELDSSFRKDVARLKGFITSDNDRVRRPYGRRECDYPRQTLFVALGQRRYRTAFAASRNDQERTFTYRAARGVSVATRRGAIPRARSTPTRSRCWSGSIISMSPTPPCWRLSKPARPS